MFHFPEDCGFQVEGKPHLIPRDSVSNSGNKGRPIVPLDGLRGPKQGILSLRKVLETSKAGVPIVVQWLTNPTRNHEVAGFVPALAQWVKDLVLPCSVV